ncbi:MAG: PEP/pyruvate-binding domain-containing protein [Bacteroidota bacterium]
MTKLEQLVWLQSKKIPTPKFIGITFEAFSAGNWNCDHLSGDLAVRSSYTLEDGNEQSFAGQFLTLLHVNHEELEKAIGQVFTSYPNQAGTSVIVQEMIEAEYSGIAFSFKEGIWKVEWGPGLGEQYVSGSSDPNTFLLPKFSKSDILFSNVYDFWQPPKVTKALKKSFIHLSVLLGQLLKTYPSKAEGLDIEFAINKGHVYILQARRITTPTEREEVLTTANHKEILPPFPSRLMTDLIGKSAYELSAYYKNLDPTLATRPFTVKTNGMPWINLSFLLDIMVKWGLPTSLVCNSIGAEDFYRVKVRPYVALFHLNVFMKVLWEQWGARKNVESWLKNLNGLEAYKAEKREFLWQQDGRHGFKQWIDDFQKVYVELVGKMQALTGAMSGPMQLMSKLGWLHHVSDVTKNKTRSTSYYDAFNFLHKGLIDKKEFIEEFGHRAFYESDLSQKRFEEYSETEWWQLLRTERNALDFSSKNKSKRKNSLMGKILSFAFSSALQAMALRELVRHETMKIFFIYRKELNQFFDKKANQDLSVWDFEIEDLIRFFSNKLTVKELQLINYTEQSSWDIDTFLANQVGRRIPIKQFSEGFVKEAICVYPGKVEGQVWRVSVADLGQLERPPFKKVILVADALDPGWVPFFAQVDGVMAYVGGILSHASIILRESQIPSITHIPTELELNTGDWIEIDAAKLEIIKKDVIPM